MIDEKDNTVKDTTATNAKALDTTSIPIYHQTSKHHPSSAAFSPSSPPSRLHSVALTLLSHHFEACKYKAEADLPLTPRATAHFRRPT
jgi:hypothetical protein